MKGKQPMDLGNRIHLIDGFDLGVEGRTGTYVIREEKLTLVETSASPSVPYILAGLKDLGLDPLDVQYIIVTHIHLDHAGGAGLLLQECPNAKVVVHPKGARHLADPSRLIQGARAVYGDKFDRLFEPIVPVPEDRLIAKGDGETLTIGAECALEFLDTPGHANHHFSIYDPVSNGIFTGDTLGVYYHQVRDILPFYLPSTSPNQFNPQAMQNSLDRIRRLNVERIYFGHFSQSEEVEEAYRQIEDWLPHFVETAEQVVKEGFGAEEVSRRLFAKVKDFLIFHKVNENHSVFEILSLDLEICSMGLVEYLAKQKK